jgi:hypothetical protein
VPRSPRASPPVRWSGRTGRTGSPSGPGARASDRSGHDEAERDLLEHRSAVRANLPADAGHVARTARWLAQQASYARLPGPTVERIGQAAEILEAIAEAVAGRIAAEREECGMLGMDRATHQRRLERAALSETSMGPPDSDPAARVLASMSEM